VYLQRETSLYIILLLLLLLLLHKRCPKINKKFATKKLT
jgi:hypothetical protein